MNLTRRGSLPFRWKVAAVLLMYAMLSALKYVGGGIFATVMGFVLFLIVICAHALLVNGGAAETQRADTD